jgi:hypothetical protein
MRVSDRMRDRASARLTRGCAEGYLSVDTLSARLDAALSARSDTDLDGLTADIPKLPAPFNDAARAVRRGAQSVRRWLLGPRQPPRLSPPRLPFDGDRAMIGRAESCNLVIDSPTVSRRHAELRLRNGDWLLSDLGSTNGTWVNGWRVEQVVLRPGDEVRLGQFTATFG